MDIILKQIGQRLHDRRKYMGMSQDILAERANVSSQTISHAESGKKAMRADTIMGVCDALEISADYLLFGKTTTKDISILEQKMSKLSPRKFRYLEEMIDCFITAATLDEK